MRTITTTVYYFDELTPEAQKKAIDNARGDVASFLNGCDSEEYRAALEKMEEVFEIKVYDWNVGYPYTYSKWRFSSHRWSSLSDDPKYLPRYLNDVERFCRNGKYYSIQHYNKETGAYNFKSRKSKVMFERNYTLTGVYPSFIADKWTGEYRWMCVKKKYTIEEYIDEMLHEFFHEWEETLDHNSSDEVVEDHIIANEYEFTEEGELI